MIDDVLKVIQWEYGDVSIEPALKKKCSLFQIVHENDNETNEVTKSTELD